MSELDADFEKWFLKKMGRTFQEAKERGCWDLDWIKEAYEVGRASRPTSHCKEGKNCACDGDTAAVRATCPNWVQFASRPAGEAVAWLHDVVQSDGEQDQALSFSPDSFPLKGVGGFESIKSTPLFLAPQATHNKCDADFVALQIASRFVPYLEPQRRAQLQVAIRDAICKATPPPSVSDDVRELTDADLIEAAAGNGDAFAMVSMLRDDVRGDDFRKHLLAFMNDVRAKFAGVVS